MNKRRVLINSQVTNKMIENCVCCDDDQYLFEQEIDAELDRRFWSRL